MKHWEVRGSFETGKGPKGHAWRENLICHVIALSARRAIQAVLEKHPGIEIWDCLHRGKIDIIYDIEEQP